MFKQRGVALISVLLIVAILMAVASRLLAGHNLVVSRHQNTFEQNQALHYVLGAETLAKEALVEDFRQTGEVDHLGEIWAQETLPFELDEGGYLEAQLTDMHACFNLNNLAVDGTDDEKKLQQQNMKTLLRNLSLPENLADFWTDWVDTGSEVTGFGAEDSEYLSTQPPHRTANRRAAHLSEIQLLHEVEPEALRALLPHVCVLPAPGLTKLNVNTANALALSALDESANVSNLEATVATERAYDDVAQFVQDARLFETQRQPDPDDPNPPNASRISQLAVQSLYFRLHARATVGETSVTLLSLLYRDPNNSGRVTVLQRDFGKLFRSNVEVTTEPAS